LLLAHLPHRTREKGLAPVLVRRVVGEAAGRVRTRGTVWPRGLDSRPAAGWDDRPMKAITLISFGGPDVLTSQTVEDPTPGPHEVLVETAAIGVNFIDTYQREGKYAVDFPFVPGFEGAGTVVEVGSKVHGISVGSRVAWPMVLHSYAELVAVPQAKLVLVPDGIDLTVAASAMLQGLTAHYLTTDVFAVKQGSVALVHAAAGGTGLALTQVVRALGGTVIGTVSNAAKAQRAKDAGAHHTITYTEEDFVAKALELTDGRGVDVIYDGIGNDTVVPGLDALARRGTMVYFGAASGAVGPFDLQMLSSKGSLTIAKPTLSDFILTHEEIEKRAHAVFSLMAEGHLGFSPECLYPLADAATAHRDLESRKTMGKVLLIP